MSERSTQEPMERMKTDEAFRATIMAEPDPEARLTLIQTEGYDCSSDDIAALGGMLADAELGSVTGGLWDVCAANTCGADCTADGTRWQ